MKQLSILFFAMVTLAFAQQPNFKQLDAYLEQLAKHDKLMGNVAIAKDGQVIYQKAVGHQFLNYNQNAKATAASKYKIGSITKTFTATMIFQLIEEGKLSLETKLSKFFPKVPNAKQITIDNMLTHTSGLFNLTNAEAFGSWRTKPATRQDMLGRMMQFKSDFEPGTEQAYSNTNYLLLGYIVEDLDKTSYADAVQNRIVKKLGLKNTYYGGAIDVEANECQSYTYEKDHWQQQTETHMSLPGGAGALVSTASDLVQFMDALFAGKLIHAQSLEQMTTIVEQSEDACRGLFCTTAQGQTVFGHDGGIDGFQSMLVHIPSANVSVALTSNGLNFNKMHIMFTAFSALMGAPIEMPTFSSIELTSEAAHTYAGIYESDAVPYDLVFEAEGAVLRGAPEGSNLKILNPIKTDEFTFDALGIHLTFDTKAQTVVLKRPDQTPILFNKKL